MARIARLAATKGGKTRAILKLAGRGAILLTVSTFNLAMWVFWAILTIFGFVSSLKRTTERVTERHCARRKLRRARAQAEHERCEREQRAAALATAAEEPAVIYSTARRSAPGTPPGPGSAPGMAPKLVPADRVVIQRPPRPGLDRFSAGRQARADRKHRAVVPRRASRARGEFIGSRLLR